MPRLRLRVAALAVASVTAATAMAIAVNASPAAAAGANYDATQLSLAYTSAAHPGKSYMNPPYTTDLPLGSSGKKDTSRVYLTYDLAQFAGKHIVSASVFTMQSTGDDCSGTATNTIEIWTTVAPSGKISWNKAPAEIAKIGTMSFRIGCPQWYGQSAVGSTIAAAVARGDKTISIELRVPAAVESNPTYGTELDGVYGVNLDVNANSVPTTPTNMSQEQFTCATAQPYPYIDNPTPTLRASSTDGDSNDAANTATYEIWPIAHPDQTTDFTSIVFGQNGVMNGYVPSGLLTDATTYAWKVRVSDGVDTSGWSPTCYFTEDMTRPATGPTVTSANFPAGGQAPPGVPGTFTFAPNGADDIIGYIYHFGFAPGGISYYVNDQHQPVFDPFSIPGVVHAGADGTTTVTLSPTNYGPASLWVESIDKAYNVSAATEYDFSLPWNGPTATPSTDHPIVGKPFTLALAPNPNAGTVDSYQIRINDGDVRTVPANADGTATTTLEFDQIGSDQVEIRSHSTSGLVSAATQLYESLDGEPIVTSSTYPENGDGGGVGVTGTFTFTPTVPGIVSYTYSFDYGDETTVAAAGNGGASVTWTPDSDGFHMLQVYATGSDGTVYNAYYYFINVASA